MSTDSHEPPIGAGAGGPAEDPALRRLVADLDALYSAPIPPEHLRTPPVLPQRATLPAAGSAPVARWESWRGPRMADPPHPVPLRSRAWQPLLRVAALTVLLLGGMLALVVGTGGLPGQLGQTPTPGPDRFAQLALLELQNSTLYGGQPPVVVLNRRVREADLPCLGLDPVPGLPADEPLRLVIVGGDLESPFATELGGVPAAVHYVGFVYIERQGVMTMGYSSRNGAMFRAALNDPTLLDDDILVMHTLPAGSQDDPVAGRVLDGQLGQALHDSQTQGGWTVALERIYADTNRVVLLYTVRGPVVRAALAPPVLALPTGPEVRLLGWTSDGPTVAGQEYTWRILTVLDPRDISPAAQWTFRVTVPAIHGVVPPPPTPLPACGPPLAAASTPLPTWTPAPPAPPAASATPAPPAPTLEPPPPPSDPPLGTLPTPGPFVTATPEAVLAGPFTFNLTVPVVPSTPLPQPVPTQRTILPTPESSAVATPLP